MEHLLFPEDFVWGAATASYQVEGAIAEDGRLPSIWDSFCTKSGAIANGHNGEVSADQYHQYPGDVKLMESIGLQAYRFSIAWTRVIPDGKGSVNPAGIAYYRNLLLMLRAADIKAMVTLYHWDLPQALEDTGGWRNRETAYAFQRYAAVCFDAFGDLVDQWITINEPWCIAYLGHLQGEHAPGHSSMAETVRVIHHVNLAHGLAVEEFKKRALSAQIGIAWNIFVHRGATKKPGDAMAARKALLYETRIFTDPVLHGSYPKELEGDDEWRFPILQGDMRLMSLPLDFIGVNYYYETVVQASERHPRGYEPVPAWQPMTAQRWPVNPGGLSRVLQWIASEAPGVPLAITENGCASEDRIERDGRVHDGERIAYIYRHLAECSHAIAVGIPLKAYYIWSFIDNFEWAWGYDKRFGIVYCDYETQERHLKDSAYFYRDVIAGYCEK